MLQIFSLFLNSLAAQNVVLHMIEPDQPFACPHQNVIYECTVTGFTGLVWTLLPFVSDNALGFISSDKMGFRRNASEGNIIATLNVKKQLEVAFLINSTVFINAPLNVFNGSNLTCTGTFLLTPELQTTTITLSGE